MVDGVRNTTIMQSVFRNTGDDAQAMWSFISAPEYNVNNAYINNTAQSPALANGAAIYGGQDNKLRNLVVKDIVAFGSGISISTHHNPHPFYGTTVVDNCLLVRSGSREHNWPADLGALWVYAKFQDINSPVVISNVDIEDSSYQGVLISSDAHTVNQLELNKVTIDGTATQGIQVFTPGSALFQNVNIFGVASAMEKPTNFIIQDGGGNNFDVAQ